MTPSLASVGGLLFAPDRMIATDEDGGSRDQDVLVRWELIPAQVCELVRVCEAQRVAVGIPQVKLPPVRLVFGRVDLETARGELRLCCARVIHIEEQDGGAGGPRAGLRARRCGPERPLPDKLPY